MRLSMVAIVAYLVLSTAALIWGNSHFGSVFVKPDETLYDQISIEMYQNRNFLVPTLEGKPSFVKPPLVYWLELTGFRIFGENIWAARLPIWILGLASVWLVFLIGSELFSPEVGRTAALLTLTNVFVFSYSQSDMMDVPLLFFVLLSLYTIMRGRRGAHFGFALSGMSVGLASLTKGPLGIVLSLYLILLNLLNWGHTPIKFGARFKPNSEKPTPKLANRHEMGTTFKWDPSPLIFDATLFLVSALVFALAWPTALASRGYWRHWVSEFILGENLGKFAGNGMPFKILLIGLLGGLAPWTFLFLESVIRGIKAMGKNRARLFLLEWILGILIIFAIPQRKLPHYVMPAIPACCLLIASFENFSAFSLFATQVLLGILGLVWIVGTRFTPLIQVKIVMATVGVLAIYGALILRDRKRLAECALLFGVLLASLPIVMPAIEFGNRKSALRELSAWKTVGVFCPIDRDPRGFELDPRFVSCPTPESAVQLLSDDGLLIVAEHDQAMLPPVSLRIERSWSVWRVGIGIGQVWKAIWTGDLSPLQEEFRAETLAKE